jgi:membrane glycosyltransferase
MKTELKNIATDLAYKLGGVLTITTVMAYSVDFKLFLNPFIGIGFGIFIILFGVYSIYQSKKQNSGIISFGEAFKSYFITISLGYFIGSLTTILIFVIIDPEAATILDEEMLVMTKEMLEGFGMSKEMIAMSLEEASKKSNFSLSSISLQYVMNIAFFSVIGLLVSLIFKKESK